MSVRPVPRHHCPGAHTLHSQHTTLVRCVQQTLTGGNSNPSIHHSTRSGTHEFSSCVRSIAYHTSSERVVDQRRCSHMSYVIHYTERCTESSRKQSCKLQWFHCIWSPKTLTRYIWPNKWLDNSTHSLVYLPITNRWPIGAHIQTQQGYRECQW